MVAVLCLWLVVPQPWAQSNERIYRVGVVEFSPLTPGSWWHTKLTDALGKFGYVEGRNLIVDGQNVRGLEASAQGAVVADLVSRRPDVIVVGGTSAAKLAAKATSSIPIVMVASVDPISAGLAETLARPGKNVTGLVSDVGSAAEQMRLDLLLELIPRARRIALVGVKADWDGPWGQALRAAAARRGVDMVFAEGQPTDYSAALESVKRTKSDAFLVAASPLSPAFGPVVAEFTIANRTPGSCPFAMMVDRGCLMSYGQDPAEFVAYAMTYVDKILKGAKPADLPIEQPTRFRLVLNLNTAKAIGLALPPSILVRADRVIE